MAVRGGWRPLSGLICEIVNSVGQGNFTFVREKSGNFKHLWLWQPCCKLNTVAWVVELTYLHVIVKCEGLLGGHGKARCTVRGLSSSFGALVIFNNLSKKCQFFQHLPALCGHVLDLS